MKISYSKGIITFEDDTKTTTYNINTGIITNEKTKRQLKRLSFSKDEIINCLWNQGYNCYDADKDLLSMVYRLLYNDNMLSLYQKETLQVLQCADKLLNLGINWWSYLCFSTVQEYQELITNSISKIVKIAKDFEQNGQSITLDGIIEELKIIEWQKKYPLLQDRDVIRNYRYTISNLIHLYGSNQEYINLAFYYFYSQKMYLIDSCANMVKDYFSMCYAMGKTPTKANNFFRELIETKQSYELWKKLDKNNRFQQQYDKIKDKLMFEYGNFQIVLPKETYDLIREGNEMHHCVGGYIDKVADGLTLIVFVRKKNDLDTPYITAEINKMGELKQYYLSYDRSISLQEDIDFKNAYQKWLTQNW